jgi:hypothetical protein
MYILFFRILSWLFLVKVKFYIKTRVRNMSVSFLSNLYKQSDAFDITFSRKEKKKREYDSIIFCTFYICTSCDYRLSNEPILHFILPRKIES